MNASESTALAYRVYSDERGARLQSGARVLILRRGDQFKLSEFKGFPCVVRDGVIYIVKADMLPKLRARSTAIKPDKAAKYADKQFDVLGHKLETYLTAAAKTITSAEIAHDFANGAAFAKFAVNSPAGEVTAVLKATAFSISASVYRTTNESLGSWDFLQKLQGAIRGVAKKLIDTNRLDAMPKFSKLKARVANVKTPWGQHFTGTILTYAAQLEL